MNWLNALKNTYQDGNPLFTMISVIVPIYNEEKILSENHSYFNNLSQRAELIFVDGGSTDKSREIAAGYGRLFSCRRGRSDQMNFGAFSSQQDILLFLHADTKISVETLSSIERSIKEDGFAGGCLTQRIDKKGLIYRFIEGEGNIRARMTKVFYGDQGIFVRKDVFLKIHGFPQALIMEDVLFTKELRKQGKTVVLHDKILVSARRWEKKGTIRTIFLHCLIIILFRLNYPQGKLKNLYQDLR